jgi:hypothetical protein
MSDFDLDHWCDLANEYDPKQSTSRTAAIPVDSCCFCASRDLFESLDMGMICRGCARVQPRGPALLAEYDRDSGTHTRNVTPRAHYTPHRNFTKIVVKLFGRNSVETASILQRQRQFLEFFETRKAPGQKKQPHMMWQLAQLSRLCGTSLVVPFKS